MLRQEVIQSPALELPVTVVARPRLGLRDTFMAYLSLTKPRIISLLLITTVPAMMVAKHGMPSLWLIALTLVGGTLAAGGANTINCYFDRDIDGIMARTRKRPLPAGSISPERALLFGVGLGVASFAILAAGVNLLSAALAMAALAFYVLVYTVWLKRSSVQNIVIGGAAGAMPPLVGWAAVRGSLDWPVLVLFGIIFLWTPPHFWALALRYRTDYAKAGVPMLPVVRGEAETNRQILLYSVMLAAASLALVPVAGMGWLYLGSASVLSGIFLWLAFRQWRESRPETSKALFMYSLLYLALLYVAMGLDQFVAR
jgi:protoheme IX farnesyltransferase